MAAARALAGDWARGGLAWRAGLGGDAEGSGQPGARDWGLGCGGALPGAAARRGPGGASARVPGSRSLCGLLPAPPVFRSAGTVRKGRPSFVFASLSLSSY